MTASQPRTFRSVVLDHSRLATNERHYATWGMARNTRFPAIVRRTHQRDSILLEFTFKKPAGSAGTLPAEAGLATAQCSQATRRASA